ncbi:interleukin-12 subunit beta isoform X2 [Esox lucius]|uniref:interleukin-12 subunit beta isoform X2 n=1 Tax=Esox lucius TaxID=8010 RepID=UPI00097325F6|nr:interleukin-12 subunit beta isoform X2 [Esox lucius]
MTLVPWVVMLLCVSLPRAQGLIFSEIYVVSDEHSSVNLTCPMAFSGPLTWTHGDQPLDSDNAQVQGHNLILNDIWHGEYSCWNGERKLGSVYLLEALKEDGAGGTDSSISCWAKSYDCIITCIWTNSEFSTVRLGLGHACTHGQENCTWVYPATNLQNKGFHFNLSHSLSPYTEEITPLVVTAEAINEFKYLRKTKRFYLRDIVQPDSPTVVTCLMNGENLEVKVEPPTTWNSPPSYFPLEHQIAYILKDNGEEKHSMELHIPKYVSKIIGDKKDKRNKGKYIIRCNAGGKKGNKTKSRPAMSANH